MINNKKLPVYYIPHGGGPCFFMDWEPKNTWYGLANYLTNFVNDIKGAIKSIVVISAHWEENVTTITANPNPSLIYDYYGFPKHTYKLKWPAKGNLELANRIKDLLNKNNFECNLDHLRGFDHGVFIPLLLTFPTPNIPTIQISLSKNLKSDFHLSVGKILEPLRSEGILIIGSGMSSHNLDVMLRGAAGKGSKEFNEWLNNTVQLDFEKRNQLLIDWEQAPFARDNHPREEHFIPLHVIAGAAGKDKGIVDFNFEALNSHISSVKFG